LDTHEEGKFSGSKEIKTPTRRRWSISSAKKENKIELPAEYNVSSTFNVSDLSLFRAGEEDFDLRTNPLQEGGSAKDMTKGNEQEALQGLGGPMTRARTIKAKETLQQAMTTILEDEPKLEDRKFELVN
jgi:hypothetical protein